MVVKYIKDVGTFSYAQSHGYSDEGIDLRSAEYFRMLHEGNFDMPVAGMRNDLYASRKTQYENRQNYQKKFQSSTLHTEVSRKLKEGLLMC